MFQYMLDTHSEWFTQCQADRTAQFGYSFLLFYQKLAVRSRSEPRNNYKIVPKFHYFFHMQEYIEETLRNVRHWVSENVFLTLRVLKGVKFPDVPIFILNSFDFFYPQVQVWALLSGWVADGPVGKDRIPMSCQHDGKNVPSQVPGHARPFLGFRVQWRWPGMTLNTHMEKNVAACGVLKTLQFILCHAHGTMVEGERGRYT